MSCFKIMQVITFNSWNIFNIAYVIWALIFAFGHESLAIRIPCSIIFSIHIIFSISLNGFLRKKLQDDDPIVECLLLLLNCSAILLSALLIILASEEKTIIRALPFLLYILPLHILCLIAACAFKRGYDIVQKVCLIRICPKSCEEKFSSKKSKLSVLCARFQNCFVNLVVCEYCCKRKTKKKKIVPNVFVKRPTFLELKSQSQISQHKQEKRRSKGSLLMDNSKSFQEEQETRYQEKSIDKTQQSIFMKSKESDSRQNAHNGERIIEEEQDQNLNQRNESLTIKQIVNMKINAGHVKKKFLDKVHRNMSQLTDVHKQKMREVVELCTICIEQMHRGEVGTILTACKHIFHTHCIEAYIENNEKAECPMCSTFIKDSVKIELF